VTAPALPAGWVASNPISGMTVATLLLTCLVFLLLGWTTPADRIAALSVAAIVCIAASNAGTTSQDLKTGFLLGATPKWQQWSILLGAGTSSLVMGWTLVKLNDAGTVYTQHDLPAIRLAEPILAGLTAREKPRGLEVADDKEYRVWHATTGNPQDVPQGKYLVNEDGTLAYLCDPSINGLIGQRDDGQTVQKFDKNGKLAVGDFPAQMKQVMQTITDILKASGAGWDRVVKVNILLARREDFKEMNSIYSTYFPTGKYPARTTAIVSLPHPDFLLEIECVAALE
jgi:enamine deaminase RidA (YjgF/YER057c/UK114 family)